MEKQIGFKYSKLREGVNEGTNNIVFIKGNSIVAYLEGYPSNSGYYIDIQQGEYKKEKIDNMTYTRQRMELENETGIFKIEGYYIFKIKEE